MSFKKYIFLNSAIILINQLNQFLIWLLNYQLAVRISYKASFKHQLFENSAAWDLYKMVF